jgi:hypothetical protein
LANAINDDANYNSTLTTALGTKLPLAGGTMTGSLKHGDNVHSKWGTGDDLDIYHDGSHARIVNYTGNLNIRSNIIDWRNQADSASLMRATNGGSVDLYCNNVKKLETTSTGVSVTGNVAVSGTVDGVDIQTLNTTAGAALPKAGGTMTGTISGFTSTGITDNATSVAMTIDSSENIDLAGDLGWEDGKKATFGGSSDLQIYHDGSNSYIYDAGTGTLNIRASSAINLQTPGGAASLATFSENGANTFYYSGSAKLATTSTGVQVTGEVLSSTGVFGLDGGDKMSFANNSHIDWNISNATEMRLEADGDLHVDGNVTAYSTTISDERLKENIQPIEDALSKVSQLKGCTFTYTADGRESAGLIAQDVEKVLPSAVIETKLPLKIDDGNEYKVLQYDQTIGLLVEAIKELSAKVEELSSKVE